MAKNPPRGICLTEYGRLLLDWMFDNIGFFMYDFPVAFLRPGGAAKLYCCVPVELCTL